jgi:hypothetical protein
MKKQEAEKMCAELRCINPDFEPMMEGTTDDVRVRVILKQMQFSSTELLELRQITMGKTIRFGRSGANVRMIISDL